MKEWQQDILQELLDNAIDINNIDIDNIKELMIYAYSNQYIHPIFGLDIKVKILYNNKIYTKYIDKNVPYGIYIYQKYIDTIIKDKYPNKRYDDLSYNEIYDIAENDFDNEMWNAILHEWRRNMIYNIYHMIDTVLHKTKQYKDMESLYEIDIKIKEFDTNKHRNNIVHIYYPFYKDTLYIKYYNNKETL